MTELPKAHAERGDEWQICRRNAKTCQRNTTGLGKTNMTPAQPHKTTVYVDTENLGGNAQSIPGKAELIKQAVTSKKWPGNIPEITLIKAYCNNGSSSLWKEALIKKLEPEKQGGIVSSIPLAIEAPEVQRFTGNDNKIANAMDLTLMLETISDLLTRQTMFAVIISNDSDYGYLLAHTRKLVQENRLNPSNHLNGLPLLILTHNQAGISEVYREFSGNVIHIGAEARPDRTAPPPSNTSRPRPNQGADTRPDRTAPPSNPSRPRPGQGAQARPGRTAPSPANGNGKRLTQVFPKMEIIKAVVSGIGQAHFNPDTGNYEFDSFNVHQAISGALGIRATETEEMKYAPIEFGKWFHRNYWDEMRKLNIKHFRDTSQPDRIIYRMNRETRTKIWHI